MSLPESNGLDYLHKPTELTKTIRLFESAEREGNILPQHTACPPGYHMLGHKSLNKLKEN